MRRFLKNLFRNVLTTRKASDGKPSTRRAKLQMEGLEDRMVLSSATLFGSTLGVNFTAGDNLELVEVNPTGNRQIEVIHGGTIIGEFSINSINHVNVSYAGQDDLVINDSDGMPFATGTLIGLSGGGTNNTMVLTGSRAFDTNETYNVTGTGFPESSLGVDGLNFFFDNALDEVIDTIPITGGPLNVTASGQNVEWSSQVNGPQTLTGLGAGGGSTLVFDVQNSVVLNETAADATVNLDAPGAVGVDNSISVATHAGGDTVVIAATSVPTNVQTLGSGSEVVLQANSAHVNVVGDSSTNPTTTMIIGKFQSSNDTDVTSGIQANVAVDNLKNLLITNDGNVSTKENVRVTEDSISGTGLFGNNSVEVTYNSTDKAVAIFSGQLADTYTVEASSSTAEFTSQINIFDDSNKLFDAKVDVNSHSHLSLEVDKLSTQGTADLFINAPHGKFSNPSDGEIDVSFSGVLTSQIDNEGFIVKEEHS
jgi:hypothetical protein